MIALPQLLAGVLALTVGDVGAGVRSAPAADARARSPARRPQHRQFDFWLGDWDVTKPDGKAAGHNRITRDPRRLRAARGVDGRERHARDEPQHVRRGRAASGARPGSTTAARCCC